MIKGLAITPPILGRISIGRVVEKNDRRLPEKDDQFTITTQVQGREGWINHPLDEILRKEAPNGKLRTLPVRLLFNDPDLNLRAEYSLFDRQSGRPLCAGNGETCRRRTSEGVQALPCPAPELCEFGKGGLCKPYGRLHGALGDDDELGSFIFRTTGFNSIRTLTARLRYYHAASGGLLACLPLALRLRGKSTTQSHRTPIYYVDLTIRDGLSLAVAIGEARQLQAIRQESGFDQQGLDEAARSGYGNAAFEVDEEEALTIMEEFYPGAEAIQQERDPVTTGPASHQQRPTPLREKLNQRALNQQRSPSQ
jgi:hypothetical protein